MGLLEEGVWPGDSGSRAGGRHAPPAHRTWAGLQEVVDSPTALLGYSSTPLLLGCRSNLVLVH